MNKFNFLCFALGIIFSNANATNYRDSFFSDSDYDSVEVMRPIPVRPVFFASEEDDDFDAQSDINEISNKPYELTCSVRCNENYQFVANMLDYEMKNKTKQFYGKNMFFDDDIGDNCLGSELAEVFPHISMQDQTLKATGPLIYTENCIQDKCESSLGNNEIFNLVHHLMLLPSFSEFRKSPKSKMTLSISTAGSPTDYLIQITACAV